MISFSYVTMRNSMVLIFFPLSVAALSYDILSGIIIYSMFGGN